MLEKKILIYDSHTGLWCDNLNPNFEGDGHKTKYPKLKIKGFEPKNILYPSYGFGNEYVYVMYETESRVEAILGDRRNWLLKVGRTNNVERRVSEISQSGPNSFVIGVVYQCNDSRALELYIHKRLISEIKKYEIPGRKEWFISNLDEVHSLWEDFKADYLFSKVTN